MRQWERTGTTVSSGTHLVPVWDECEQCRGAGRAAVALSEEDCTIGAAQAAALLNRFFSLREVITDGIACRNGILDEKWRRIDEWKRVPGTWLEGEDLAPLPPKRSEERPPTPTELRDRFEEPHPYYTNRHLTLSELEKYKRKRAKAHPLPW